VTALLRCSKCGRELTSEARFCSFCGSEVSVHVHVPPEIKGPGAGTVIAVLLIIFLIVAVAFLMFSSPSYRGGIPIVSRPDIRLGDWKWSTHGILDVKATVDFQLINYGDAGGSVIVSFEFSPSGLYHQRQYYVPAKTTLSFTEELDCKWDDNYLRISLTPA